MLFVSNEKQSKNQGSDTNGSATHSPGTTAGGHEGVTASKWNPQVKGTPAARFPDEGNRQERETALHTAGHELVEHSAQ
jgi:hypothetical protein